ncbi:MAG: hypothetical protein MUE42_04780 [Opitutaceae bacterium]|nr:hypothetical protein [Opitutaceae bacterium]
MPSFRSLLGTLGLAVFFAFAPAPVRAQPAEAEAPKKELSEKTGAALGRLRPLVDAKDYAGALALIEPLLAAAPGRSFDRYVLAQIQAQILLTQGKLIEAIPPLETALRLGEGNPAFFDAASNREQLNLLAQLHYQRATDLKGVAAQEKAYLVALGYLTRWLERSPRPTAEVRTFAASLLYQLGTLREKPDAARIREAITQSREALLLSPAPSAQLQLVLVACHLQLGENARAAERLEAIVARDPANVSAWSQLQSIYLAQAAETKDEAEARAQNLRALHVLERAQPLGHLNSARDHYTRVAILFNLRQYSRAAAALEAGLAGSILENSRRNWELLASAYQQLGQDARAIDALTRATALFPADGALDFALAQLLYATGQIEPAYQRAEQALGKGLEKPGPTEAWLAYLAFELQRPADAARWVERARASGQVPASTLDPLAAAITEALRRRA